MRFGLGRLRLSSEEFWAMTPLELAAAARAFVPPGSEPPDRGALQELLTRYPDTLPA